VICLIRGVEKETNVLIISTLPIPSFCVMVKIEVEVEVEREEGGRTRV
jgi:hypothetical protein